MTVRAGILERSLIVRSCSMWLLTRLLVTIAFLLHRLIAPSVAAGPHPVFLPASAAIIIVGVSATLTWLLTRRWFENLMLANLGTPPWFIAGLLMLPPLILEVVIAQFGAV